MEYKKVVENYIYIQSNRISVWTRFGKSEVLIKKSLNLLRKFLKINKVLHEYDESYFSVSLWHKKQN